MAPTPLTCHVYRTSQWSNVRVDGQLDVNSAATLRTTVLKCLADEPAAIILDLKNLICPANAPLTILTALARAAAAWPGIPLVAHSAAADLVERLRTMAVTWSVTVVPDAAAAAVHLSKAKGPASVRMDLVSTSDLAHIRATARQVCERAGRPAVADTVEVVVTELATNALCHGTGSRTVILSASPYHLHVAVRDGSAEVPHVREPGDDEHGRGLHIVEALSTAWGSTPTRDGKVVWATVRPRR
jgi:anti-sigma regulatory factor (Ser/Thr protein kinase)